MGNTADSKNLNCRQDWLFIGGSSLPFLFNDPFLKDSTRLYLKSSFVDLIPDASTELTKEELSSYPGGSHLIALTHLKME
jgi:hypothetical protein